MIEGISAIVLLAGSLFILIAGLGILRLPDTLCRAHALSKVLPVGLSLILLVQMCLLGSYSAGIKVLLIVLFHLVTIPLAAHIFALYATKR